MQVICISLMRLTDEIRIGADLFSNPYSLSQRPFSCHVVMLHCIGRGQRELHVPLRTRGFTLLSQRQPFQGHLDRLLWFFSGEVEGSVVSSRNPLYLSIA